MQYEYYDANKIINPDHGNFYILIVDGCLKLEGKQYTLSQCTQMEYKKNSMITDLDAKKFSNLDISLVSLEETLLILLPLTEFGEELEQLQQQKKRLLRVEVILSKLTGNQKITLNENLSSLFRDKYMKKGMNLTEEGKEGNIIYFVKKVFAK